MSSTELNELFGRPSAGLEPDVLNELQSIVRLHSIPEQELFFKWEAYSIKMGTENSNLDYKTVRDFKKDLQDALERDSRGKMHVHGSANRKGHTATPRNPNSGDVYGVLDGMTSGTPRSGGPTIKRKSEFGTPSAKASKAHMRSSPNDHKGGQTPTDSLDATKTATSFADRLNRGQVVESLNSHIEIAQTSTPPSESRVKMKANTELSKFNYRPMAMKLSEASEILDDRIDEFASLIQEHHGLPDSAFGNPAAQSTAEIVAVGRIASDASEGKLNAASVVLESSRRMGAGLRVPLRMQNLAYDFFPGKIVALRGTNPSGEYFSASEVLDVPLLPLPASRPSELEVHNARLGTDDTALRVLLGSGPYTPDTDLSYSALHALLDRAAETTADVLILNGPFLDLEHPMIESGDFDLPADFAVSPDRATLTDAFRAFISEPLSRLAQRVPSITIILVPSVRDSISNHVSWPQDRFPKRELGLPKQVTCVTNPITLSINELVVGISSQDVLYEMQRQTVAQGTNRVSDDLLARLSAGVIQQRHFFPVFPPLAPESLPKPTSCNTVNGDVDGIREKTAVGSSVDIAYSKLGEWLHVRPDLLIVPSMLTPFAKVVESVVVVNPGSVSKRRGAGTFAELRVKARTVSQEEAEAEVLGHELFNRARVDVVRI